MPKVKKKTAAKRKTGKAAKSARGRTARRAPSFIERTLGQFHRLTLAGVVGATMITVGIVAALWAGGYVGLMSERADRAMRGAAIASGFDIRRITLMGRQQAAFSDVEVAIGPVVGASIGHFDLDAAKARVEDLGWVRTAAVSRLWPNTIHVSIREREPAAVWQLSGALHLIDDEGAIIKEVSAYEYASLPLIVGAGAPDATAEILQALAAHPDIEERTAALVRVGERRWNMRLRNKVDVKLPEHGFADALDYLAILQSAHGILDQDNEYIDLRNPDVVIRPRENAPEAAQ
ncbi:MAG: cell division protein FtsQ/DivIB [Pseudomonadota bacterium]